MHTKKIVGVSKRQQPDTKLLGCIKCFDTRTSNTHRIVKVGKGGGGQEEATILGTKLVVHVMYL